MRQTCQPISILLHRNLSLPISTGLGQAIFSEDGSTLEQLLHIADQRMYKQKRAIANASNQQDG